MSGFQKIKSEDFLFFSSPRLQQDWKAAEPNSVFFFLQFYACESMFGDEEHRFRWNWCTLITI